MTNDNPIEYHLAAIFSCARCGHCCHGETTVSLDEHDQQRMAETLNLSVEGATKQYWRVGEHQVQMVVEDGHCIFFDGEVGCTVHEGRPWRCRQWPLHPSILVDEANFKAIATSCPGINTEIGYLKFCQILKNLLNDPDRTPYPGK